MRRLLLFAFLTATPALFAQSAPNPAKILAAESLFWTNYTSANIHGLDEQLARDFTSIEEERQNRTDILKFVGIFHQHCTLAPVVLREPQVIFLTPTIATLTYRAIESPTCGDKSISGDTNISSVWVNQQGHWKLHLHTEYAIPPK